MGPSPSFDFDKITTAISRKTDEILDLLEHCQVQCILPSVSAFESQYSIRHKPSASQITDGSECTPTIAELSEAFKVLEKMPSCFPKIQRKHPIQSSCKKQNSSKCNESLSSSAVSNTSLTKFNVNDVSATTKLLLAGCKDRYEKFQQTLKKTTVSSLSARQEYEDSVQDLRRALEDLEKLIPRGLDASVDIFHADEEQAISIFREELDALLCIQENRDIYPNVDMPDDPDLDDISKLAGGLLQL